MFLHRAWGRVASDSWGSCLDNRTPSEDGRTSGGCTTRQIEGRAQVGWVVYLILLLQG